MRHLAPVPLFANGHQVRVSRDEFGVPPIFGHHSSPSRDGDKNGDSAERSRARSLTRRVKENLMLRRP